MSGNLCRLPTSKSLKSWAGVIFTAPVPFSGSCEALLRELLVKPPDIVRRVEGVDGSYYALEDRIKDLINRGGEKINAQEIEALLLDHPAIAEVALVENVEALAEMIVAEFQEDVRRGGGEGGFGVFGQ